MHIGDVSKRIAWSRYES